MTIFTGWREQYDRMLRSHARLLTLLGDATAVLDDVRDALFHFFTDAYHLSDWLHSDHRSGLSSSQRKKARSLFNASRSNAMALCADVANGIKHFGLDRPGRMGNTDTSLVEHMDRSLNLGAFEIAMEWGENRSSSAPAVTTAEETYRWSIVWVEGDGTTRTSHRRDAVETAEAVVDIWREWLRTRESNLKTVIS